MRVRSDNPFAQLSELRDAVLDSLAIERRRQPARAQAWQPPTDLAASDDEYIVLLDLPGVTREQIEATARDGLLRIRGVSAQPEEAADAQAVRSERPRGQFVRSVHLPTDADMSRISAKLAEGVLEVRVGRRRPESSRIEIAIAE